MGRFLSTGKQSSPYFIAASKGSAELYCCTEGDNTECGQYITNDDKALMKISKVT